jgi:thioredoxin 1
MEFIKKATFALVLSTGFLFYSCSASSNGSKSNNSVSDNATEKVSSEADGIVFENNKGLVEEVFKPLDLTDLTFNDAVGSGIVLVDFWAVWCPPCRVQGPIVEDLAKEVGSWATIAKVDVDRNANVAAAHNIQNIPTLLIFKNGKVVKRFVGLQQKDVLMNALNEIK